MGEGEGGGRAESPIVLRIILKISTGTSPTLVLEALLGRSLESSRVFLGGGGELEGVLTAACLLGNAFMDMFG